MRTMAAWAGSVGLAVVLAAGAAHASWELRAAARDGDLARVARALAAGDDPSGVRDEPSPLMEATIHGHVAVMDALHAAGADLERRDHDGDRAIHWAISFRQDAAVAWLLRHGASALAPGRRGKTPLLAAVAVGSLPIVERLLAAGASVRDRDDSGWGPVYTATLWAPDDVLAAVLTAGGDANESDGASPPEPALIAAAARGQARKVALLLAHGARPSDGDAAWHAAARLGAADAMAALLPLVKATPEGLVRAALAGEPKAVARFLTDGIALEAVAEGMTALTAAARGGHEALVTELLGRGALREPPGIASALELAASDAVATRILDPGPLAQATLDQALVSAAADGRVPRVKLLIARGANPRGRDAAGRTPLERLDEAIARHAATTRRAAGHRGIPGWALHARTEHARLVAARPELRRLLGR